MGVSLNSGINHFPRAQAIQVISQVLNDKKRLDLVLEGSAHGNSAWLREICYGVLRWKSRLDFIIDASALKKKPTGYMRKALYLGAYQLIALDDVPQALTVSETVQLVKSKLGEPPGKFANAILRKIADHRKKWREWELSLDASDEELIQWASLPLWLWKNLVEEQGLDWTKKFALASLKRPSVWFRSKPDHELPAAWTQPGPIAGAWKWMPPGGGARSTTKENKTNSFVETKEFHSGRFIVQNITSQVVVKDVTLFLNEHFQSLINRQEKTQILDLCAAPGGKAISLSWNGFDVIATDIDEQRLQILQSNIRRVLSPMKVIPYRSAIDLRDLDCVWIDAPCTGIGTLSKNPEIRWTKSETDVEKIKAIQKNLIQDAWKIVRKSGVLIYSICSLLQKEGMEHFDKLGLMGQVQKKWMIAPQDEPHGDGFTVIILKK